jgi:hypothetical protein
MENLKRNKNQRRFFYHYNKHNRGMTLHYKGKCIPTTNIVCMVPCETKWNKNQPHLVMRGWANGVDILKNEIIVK